MKHSTKVLLSALRLDGTGIIVAGDKRNFFHGVDMLGDQEKFDLWYSKDNREFRLAVEFNLGSQVAYPNKVVISQNANESGNENA